MMLYKNLDKCWVDKFWQQGEVLLRPLTYFATTSDPTRADDLEGRRGLRVRPQEPINVPLNELWTPPNIELKGGYLKLQPSSRADIHEHLLDAYLFCVSEEMLPKFGDSAYQISNPTGFGKALAAALKAQGVPVIEGTVARVRYGGSKDEVTNREEMQRAARQLAPEAGLQDYFHKPSRYQDEREWRYIFVLAPDAKADDMKKISDKALHEFCTRVP